MKYTYQSKSQWLSIEYQMKTLLHVILDGVFLRYYHEKVSFHKIVSQYVFSLKDPCLPCTNILSNII